MNALKTGICTGMQSCGDSEEHRVDSEEWWPGKISQTFNLSARFKHCLNFQSFDIHSIYSFTLQSVQNTHSPRETSAEKFGRPIIFSSFPLCKPISFSIVHLENSFNVGVLVLPTARCQPPVLIPALGQILSGSPGDAIKVTRQVQVIRLPIWSPTKWRLVENGPQKKWKGTCKNPRRTAIHKYHNIISISVRARSYGIFGIGFASGQLQKSAGLAFRRI